MALCVIVSNPYSCSLVHIFCDDNNFIIKTLSHLSCFMLYFVVVRIIKISTVVVMNATPVTVYVKAICFSLLVLLGSSKMKYNYNMKYNIMKYNYNTPPPVFVVEIWLRIWLRFRSSRLCIDILLSFYLTSMHGVYCLFKSKSLKGRLTYSGNISLK